MILAKGAPNHAIHVILRFTLWSMRGVKVLGVWIGGEGAGDAGVACFGSFVVV